MDKQQQQQQLVNEVERADADLAALVRGLPERYAMKPAARRALLRSRKVI